jgi:molybdate transport system substrate-binding protein
VVGLGLLAAACGGGGDEGTSGSGQPRPGGTAEVSGELNVFAGASLTEPFKGLGKAFEARYPGVRVKFNFGHVTLADQIIGGAEADVFAIADEPLMKRVVDTGNAVGPRTFARNRLAIVVAKGNPKGIRGLSDLAKPGLVVLLCSPQVPCGRFGTEALQKAGVKAQARSLEEGVNAIVSKVTLGEADAGIVYASDVKAGGDKIEGVDIPDDHNVIAGYPITVLTKARNSEAARAWADFVGSGEGQGILTGYGFMAP